MYDTDRDVLHIQKSLKQPATVADVEAMHYHETAGDFVSGRSFPEEIARALEAKSETGWQTGWVQLRNYTEIRIDKMHQDCSRCRRNKAVADQIDKEQGVIE